MKISAVIPTRNRVSSLRRTLQSLFAQTRPADEIIVVDSSDDKSALESLKHECAAHPVIWMDTIASVCVQRNAGIRSASGDRIFLCDDDIELKPDYLEKLEAYVEGNHTCGAVAGRLLQLEKNGRVDQYPVKDFKELLWRFVFQLTIWGSIDNIKISVWQRPFYFLIKRFYSGRGNTLTLSGWPLITDWRQEAFCTRIYSLGANLIKSEWLLKSPYDEVLDPSGIGDNYGVAINFPQGKPIHVLGSTCAYHHRESSNRLNRMLAYYRRILALHYFILRKGDNTFVRTSWFIWSLVGNALMYLFSGDRKYFKATCKAIGLIVFAKNPYWAAFLKRRKIVEPNY